MDLAFNYLRDLLDVLRVLAACCVLVVVSGAKQILFYKKKTSTYICTAQQHKNSPRRRAAWRAGGFMGGFFSPQGLRRAARHEQPCRAPSSHLRSLLCPLFLVLLSPHFPPLKIEKGNTTQAPSCAGPATGHELLSLSPNNPPQSF